MNYENEIWKDIIIEKNGIIYDYTGLYKISNYGRVKSLDRIDCNGKKQRGKILKFKKQKGGYLRITLCNGGKQEMFQVHRIVATAFIPNPDNLPVVNHKDENPSNNCVKNLEWCTVSYNNTYGSAANKRAEKLTGGKNPNSKKVKCIETNYIFDSIAEAKKWLGKGSIGACCRGEQATAGGYHWEYVQASTVEEEEEEVVKEERGGAIGTFADWMLLQP